MADDGSRGYPLTSALDVSEHVKADEAPAEAEMPFRLLAENAADVVYQLAPDESFMWVSPSVREVLGWDPADMVGRSLADFIHPDDLGLILEARKHPIDGVVSVDALRHRRRDGSYLWVSGRAHIITDDAGQVLCRTAALWDVEGLVRAREAVEVERARLAATVDSLMDPHVLLGPVCDDSGRIVDFVVARVNAAACTYLRTTREELVGARLLRVVPGQAGSAVLALCADVIESGKPLAAEDYAFSHEIQEFHRIYDIRAVRVGDELSVTWRDVTDAYEARAAMAEREGQLRTVLATTTVHVSRWTLDRRLIFSNRMIGLADDAGEDLGTGERVGRTAEEIGFTGDVLAEWNGAVDSVLATGHSVRYENRLPSPDGPRWYSIDVAPELAPDGSVRAIACFISDVTVDHDNAAARVLEQERFRTSVDALTESFVIFLAVRDAAGRIVDFRFNYVNRAAIELFQRPADLIVGKTYFEMFPDSPELFGWFLEVVETGESCRKEVATIGGAIEGVFDLGLAKLGDGVVTTALDITARRKDEDTRIEQEELMRVVLDNASDAIMRLDRDLRVQFVNRRLVEIFAFPADAWIGKTLRGMGCQEDLAAISDGHTRQVFETGESIEYQFELDSAEGHRYFETIATPEFARDGSVAHVISTSRDVTDRRAREEKTAWLATHDPLTGLANRTELLDEIARALSAGRRSGRSTAVLMIDLDHFKSVNDARGHAVGDLLLQACARRMEELVRAGDLVARIGGDEFVIVVRDLDDPSDAVDAAWRLVGGFRNPFSVEDTECRATASVGVAIASGSSKADDVLREADAAMYAAKAGGRDRVSKFKE